MKHIDLPTKGVDGYPQLKQQNIWDRYVNDFTRFATQETNALNWLHTELGQSIQELTPNAYLEWTKSLMRRLLWLQKNFNLETGIYWRAHFLALLTHTVENAPFSNEAWCEVLHCFNQEFQLAFFPLLTAVQKIEEQAQKTDTIPNDALEDMLRSTLQHDALQHEGFNLIGRHNPNTLIRQKIALLLGRKPVIRKMRKILPSFAEGQFMMQGPDYYPIYSQDAHRTYQEKLNAYLIEWEEVQTQEEDTPALRHFETIKSWQHTTNEFQIELLQAATQRLIYVQLNAQSPLFGEKALKSILHYFMRRPLVWHADQLCDILSLIKDKLLATELYYSYILDQIERHGGAMYESQCLYDALLDISRTESIRYAGSAGQQLRERIRMILRCFSI